MKFQDIWFDGRVESCATASCSTGNLGVFDLNISCARYGPLTIAAEHDIFYFIRNVVEFWNSVSCVH